MEFVYDQSSEDILGMWGHDYNIPPPGALYNQSVYVNWTYYPLGRLWGMTLKVVADTWKLYT